MTTPSPSPGPNAQDRSICSNGASRRNAARWSPAKGSLQAGSAWLIASGSSRALCPPTVRAPNQDCEQITNELELARVGRAEQGDLIGERPKRFVAVAIQRAHLRGDDRVEIVDGAARSVAWPGNGARRVGGAEDRPEKRRRVAP